MKKVAFLALTMVMAFFIVGCSQAAEPAAQEDVLSATDGKVFGFIEVPGTITVDQINALMGTNFSSMNQYPTYIEALSALKSERVDAIMLPVPQGQYAVKTDPTLALIAGIKMNPVQVSMLTQSGSTDLLNQINAALAALKESGELDALNEKYIVDTIVDDAQAPEVVAGQDTVVVGISGDTPPFDFVAADGTPDGYNVALMNAIAKEAGFNVEFVNVPFSAKFSALLSDRIDVFFFHGGMLSQDGVVATDVYYADLAGGLLVRNEE